MRDSDKEDPVKLLFRIGVKRFKAMLQSGIRLCDEALELLEVESEEHEKKNRL